MTKQTHTVATDALATLGTIIDETAGRDAIHLAVEPVIAAHKLYPGQDVGLDGIGHAWTCENPVGIVDPFLKAPVQMGQRFWLVVYPRKITSLRHVWEHPEIPTVSVAVAPKYTSDERWIRDFAERVGLGYETVLDGARDWVASKKAGEWGEYLNFGGLLEGEYVPDEFWPHYEAVTGETVSEDHRGSFFTCSC